MRRSLRCALCDTSEQCFICMNFEAVIIKIMAFCNVMCCPLVLRTCDVHIQGIKWARITPLNLLYLCTKLRSTTSQKYVILMWICCFHLCTLPLGKLGPCHVLYLTNLTKNKVSTAVLAHLQRRGT